MSSVRPGGTRSTGLALARAKHALAAAGLDPDAQLSRASSVTNEVWLCDDYVIRVNRRLDKRLWREARLGPLLPAEVRYPEIVAYGTGSGYDWLIARRRPGIVLSRSWPAMPPESRRNAVRQLAAMLRSLHTTPPPDAMAELSDLGTPPLLRGGQGIEPVATLLEGLARVASMAHVDAAAIREVTGYVRRTAAVLEPFDTRTLIHGDLTFENVLWDGHEVSALIDFEWSRPAPRDLDLDVLLRFCAYPFLHVADDYAERTTPELYEEVPDWLRVEYPALFSAPRLKDRLRLYAIAFETRELLASPPSAPARRLSEHHPLNRLLRLIQRRSYLDDGLV